MDLPGRQIASSLNRPLMAEGAWLIAAQASHITGTLISLKIVAPRIGAHEYGLLALALTLVVLVSQTLFSGLSTGAARSVADAQANNRSRILLIVAARLLISLAVLVLVASIVAFFVLQAADGGLGGEFAFFIAAQCIVSGASGLILAILNARRLRRFVAGYLFLEITIRALGLLLFLQIVDNPVEAVLIAYTVAMGLIVVPVGAWLWRATAGETADAGSGQYHGIYRSQLLAFSLPLAIAGLCGFLQFSADRWILESLLGLSAVGLYAVIAQIAFSPSVLAAQTLHDWVAPVLYENNDAGSRILRVSVWVIVMISAAVFFMVLYFEDQVIAFFLPASYGDPGQLFPLLVVAGLFTALGNLLSVRLLAGRRPVIVMYIRVVSATMGLGSVFFLVPHLGLDGAGLAGVLAAVFYCLATGVSSTASRN